MSNKQLRGRLQSYAVDNPEQTGGRFRSESARVAYLEYYRRRYR